MDEKDHLGECEKKEFGKCQKIKIDKWKKCDHAKENWLNKNRCENGIEITFKWSHGWLAK